MKGRRTVFERSEFRYSADFAASQALKIKAVLIFGSLHQGKEQE
jgi:hypothetical protein